MDRSEFSRVLGKVLAYAACGKRDDARQWAARLVSMLQAEGLVCAMAAAVLLPCTVLAAAHPDGDYVCRDSAMRLHFVAYVWGVPRDIETGYRLPWRRVARWSCSAAPFVSDPDDNG